MHRDHMVDEPKPETYALVNESGEVVNIVLWNGKAKWSPPKNHQAVKDAKKEARIGGKHKDGKFHDPPRPPKEEPELEAEPISDDTT